MQIRVQISKPLEIPAELYISRPKIFLGGNFYDGE